MLGLLIVTVLLALSCWGVIGTVIRLRRVHATGVWWLVFTMLSGVGLTAGSWLAFHFNYQVSPRMRFVSFPMPVAFSHLEEGQWVDFPTPPQIMYPGLAANVVAVVAVCLLPLLITSAILGKGSEDEKQTV
jgi:hypothetical protein